MNGEGQACLDTSVVKAALEVTTYRLKLGLKTQEKFVKNIFYRTLSIGFLGKL